VTGSNKPLRVCFINLRAYPLFNPEVKATIGGAEVDLYLIATELAKDGDFKVSFVTGDYGQPEVEEREGVSIIKSLDMRSNLFLSGWRIWRALGRADADVYFDECASLRTWLDAMFCRWRGRPYIYRTAHTDECDGTYARTSPVRGRAFFQAIRSAAQVITQNLSDQRDLQETASVGSRVIRNACRLPSDTGAERDTILWVGRSASQKQPRLFLDLARQMPDRSFTMICQPAFEDPAFANLAAEAAGVRNLRFLERVSFHQIDTFFQRARVFVSTSDSEGFPNVFVQAAKCGTPIVSYKVNPDGFLDKYKCGLCAEGNWQQFGGMLRRLSDPVEFAFWSANARKYASQMHNIAAIIEEYKELFRCFAKRR
jgi:glycosyltransferase involved in cell wall biosynthesis